MAKTNLLETVLKDFSNKEKELFKEILSIVKQSESNSLILPDNEIRKKIEGAFKSEVY